MAAVYTFLAICAFLVVVIVVLLWLMFKRGPAAARANARRVASELEVHAATELEVESERTDDDAFRKAVENFGP